jgi:competence ComEA-like helix-hairpin-helix protein
MASRKRATSSVLLLLAFCFLTTICLGSTKKPPPKPININTANSEELQQVPGIGPATADKILQMRKSYGAFKSVDDLLSIRGIGKKRLEKMRKYLTTSRSGVNGKPAACTGCAKPGTSATKAPPIKSGTSADVASESEDSPPISQQ